MSRSHSRSFRVHEVTSRSYLCKEEINDKRNYPRKLCCSFRCYSIFCILTCSTLSEGQLKTVFMPLSLGISRSNVDDDEDGGCVERETVK